MLTEDGATANQVAAGLTAGGFDGFNDVLLSTVFLAVVLGAAAAVLCIYRRRMARKPPKPGSPKKASGGKDLGPTKPRRTVPQAHLALRKAPRKGERAALVARYAEFAREEEEHRAEHAAAQADSLVEAGAAQAQPPPPPPPPPRVAAARGRLAARAAAAAKPRAAADLFHSELGRPVAPLSPEQLPSPGPLVAPLIAPLSLSLAMADEESPATPAAAAAAAAHQGCASPGDSGGAATATASVPASGGSSSALEQIVIEVGAEPLPPPLDPVDTEPEPEPLPPVVDPRLAGPLARDAAQGARTAALARARAAKAGGGALTAARVPRPGCDSAVLALQQGWLEQSLNAASKHETRDAQMDWLGRTLNGMDDDASDGSDAGAPSPAPGGAAIQRKLSNNLVQRMPSLNAAQRMPSFNMLRSGAPAAAAAAAAPSDAPAAAAPATAARAAAPRSALTTAPALSRDGSDDSAWSSGKLSLLMDPSAPAHSLDYDPNFTIKRRTIPLPASAVAASVQRAAVSAAASRAGVRLPAGSGISAEETHDAQMEWLHKAIGEAGTTTTSAEPVDGDARQRAVAAARARAMERAQQRHVQRSAAGGVGGVSGGAGARSEDSALFNGCMCRL